MDWTQVLTIIGSNIAFTLTLWLWSRSESREDIRAVNALVEAIRADTKAFQEAVRVEMKDFHGRLCAIEENRRK